MEGVFGDHKNHYGLRKIRMRGEKREKLMVFFATMTANAVKITKMRARQVSPSMVQAADGRKKAWLMHFQGAGMSKLAKPSFESP